MTPSSWATKPLSDVIQLKRGFDLPSPQRIDGPVPILGSFGITGWHTTPKVKGPGVTVGRSGASMGVATYSSVDFWPLNTALFVEDFKGNDPRWVYWLLHSTDFSVYNSGSAQPMLNRNYIANMLVGVPPVAEQRRIAGVLGVLDELLTTNQKLITALLSMADALALAAVSTGEPLRFGDVVDISGGGTPPTKNASYWGGEIKWATPTDVTALSSPYLTETTRRITRQGLDACSSAVHPAGSIFMTSRATIGAFAIPQDVMATNQGFIVLEPRADIDRWFLFHEMRRRVPEFIQRANGSTFLELSRGVFKDLPVLWPDESVRKALARQLDPIHAAAAALQGEIADMSRVRNEIMPLLLSGAAKVSEVEA